MIEPQKPKKSVIDEILGREESSADLKAADSSTNETVSDNTAQADTGYRAFEKKRGSKPTMLEMRFRNNSFGLGYAFIRGYRFDNDKAKEQKLTLYTAIGRVDIFGEYLEELKQLISNHELDWIQQYYADRHGQTDEGKPVIKEIIPPDSGIDD